MDAVTYEQGEWRATAFKDFMTQNIEVHVTRRHRALTWAGEGLLDLVEFKEGDRVPLLLRIPRDSDALEGILAFCGVLLELVPPSDNRTITAELEATKAHLEDMRAFFKKKVGL